jgi:lipid-binding SYLF domain-containing protein
MATKVIKSYVKNFIKDDFQKNPLPKSTVDEDTYQATRILKQLTSSPESRIPSNILQTAKGIAILSVVKGAFMFGGRFGSGIVISRCCAQCGWSAPTAISVAGVSHGWQIGAELTDFVIVLNSKKAVKAFTHGNLTLGGNLSIAAGPVGRNAEIGATVAAPLFSYSRTRGVFAGVSLEGTVVIVRTKVNKRAYGADYSPSKTLCCSVRRSEAAEELYEVLRECDV